MSVQNLRQLKTPPQQGRPEALESELAVESLKEGVWQVVSIM